MIGRSLRSRGNPTPVKILFVTQHYLPEMGALPGRISEMAREWTRLGHEVHVLSPVPNHPTGVVPPAYRGKPYFEEQDPFGIRATRTWIYTAPNKGKVRRSLAFGSFLLTGTIAGISVIPDVDVVIGTSPQPLAAFAAFAIATAKRRPFVLEVRDLWPESIVSVGALSATHPIVRVMRVAMDMLAKRAKRLVVVTKAFEDEYARRGIDRSKVAYMPNGVDLTKFVPVDAVDGDREFLGGASLPGEARKIVVSYMGTHGMAHDLSRLLDVADRLKRSHPNVAFAFIGDGAERKNLEQSSEKRGLTNVRFLGVQPRDRMPALYAATDLCVVPLRKDDLFKTVLPSKIFEIMAMRKPMALAVDGEAREIVERAGGGMYVPPGDTDALTEAIRTLVEDPDRLRVMGERSRTFVEREFDRTKIARDYANLLAAAVS